MIASTSRTVDESRKNNNIAMFLGSIDSESRQQKQPFDTADNSNAAYKNKNNGNSPTGSSIDFWRLSSSNNRATAPV